MRNVVRLIVISLALASSVNGARASGNRHVEDATLRSVHFLDKDEGWVVGDEGVILHTIDGGRHWERQTSNTRASLRSVHFLTPFIGWAVGREELPYGMEAAGVVLFTRDGGLEWKKQLPNTLPGLNQVRFADPRIGFLLGDGSDLFPSGIFKTTDAGKSWEPMPGPRTTSWLAGDFFTDGKTGVLAGGWSRLAVVRDTQCSLAEHADWLAGRDITSLQILGKKTLAVGQGGLILTSASAGKAWNFAETRLPTEVLANLDFNSLCSAKEHVWIVGRPGSVLLHSGDGGATWDLRKTGQTLPLYGVFFFDEKVGYAVGDAGTILASKDGGKSWTIQHQAGKRAAAMILHSLNKNAAVDTVTLLGAADGYLTTSLRITAPDPAVAAWDRLQDARRYSFAMRQAGGLTGETLWHFPMPQHLQGSERKAILGHWNQLHAKRAEEELMRQLVLSLRVWRPDVLVSEHPASKIPLSALLGEAVQEAVRRAADVKAFPEQLAELGLEAWQVRKVYGLSEGTDGLRQDNDEARPILNASVRDFAAAAHGLLTERYTPLPRERMHHLLIGASVKGVERHLLEGIEAKVGVNKRDIQFDAKVDAKLAQHLAQRRSVLSMAQNLDDPARTLKLVPRALDELPDEHAAPAAFAIAGRYAERGQWYLAQEIYLYLVDRCPAHPLSAEAYRWLVRLNTSGEARRRHELKHFALGEPIGVARKDGTALPKDKVIRVGNDEPILSLLQRPETRDWNKGSTEWMKRLGGYGSLWLLDPRMQFCQQAARRQLGDLAGSQDAMTKFSKFVPAGAWHDAAAAELWNANRVLQSPRRLGKARYTEARPYLDGKFDDPCWLNMKPMVLDNAVGDTTKQYATEAMLAFDQEFLYVALKCTHPAGQQVAPVKPRPRDAEVDAFDRVSILLDLDRDHGTYYHLEVDQRGCLRDSCWGDRSWNPRWFVAVHSTETAWQIEAAIPLAELTGDRITQSTAWAFNLVRVLPGRGVQSWSAPADVEPRPEGMSLLLFQTGPARPMPMLP